MAYKANSRSGVIATARRRLPVIAFALAVLLVFGAYYLYYIRLKTAYVVSRDMRILSSAALQLDKMLNAKSQIVKNFATTDDWPAEYKRTAEEQPLDRFMGDLDHVLRDVPAEASTRTSDRFEQRLVSTNGQSDLEIEYWAPGNTRHATGRISFERIMAEVFEPMSAFDSVLLVRGDGSVLYQLQPGQQIRRIGGLGRVLRFGGRNTSASPSDLVISNLSSLRERSGWNSDQPLSLDRVRNSSKRSEVTLSDGTYILLSQPYAFQTPSSRSIAIARGATAKEMELNGWTICGVVDKARFTSETWEISTSILSIVSALLLLIL